MTQGNKENKEIEKIRKKINHQLHQKNIGYFRKIDQQVWIDEVIDRTISITSQKIFAEVQELFVVGNYYITWDDFQELKQKYSRR